MDHNIVLICDDCDEKLHDFRAFNAMVRENAIKTLQDMQGSIKAEPIEYLLQDEDEVYQELERVESDLEDDKTLTVSLLPYKRRLEKKASMKEDLGKVAATIKSEPKVSCDVCGATMKENSLRTHRYKHFKKARPLDDEPRVKCETCGKVMKASSLRTHRYRHKVQGSDDELRPKMEHRDANGIEVFVDPHMVGTAFSHHEEDRQACEICGKVMKPNSLKTHMYKHRHEAGAQFGDFKVGSILGP